MSIYTEHFGFRGDPFADTADLNFFYTNSLYQKAYTTLLTGIREYKGFLLLTGETGTGKTTLLRRLMKDIEASGHYVFFDSTSLASATIDDLLYFVCAELGLHGGDNERAAKLRMFSAYLTALVNKGGAGVLLVDEAHHLNDDVLGGLRLIAPLDMKSERLLLQIVLVGQPELESRLEQPKLRPIHQRVALRCRLDRLRDDEIPAYVAHRLQTAGCDRQDLFASEALRRLAHSSNGIPRLINIICDNALLLAYGEKSRTVSAQLIDEAAAKLRVDRLRKTETLSGPDFPLPDSSSIPAVSQVLVPPGPPLLPQQKEPDIKDSNVVALTPRGRRWGYLAVGLLLALGMGWFLREQRIPLFSLLVPHALEITRVTPAADDSRPLVLPEGQVQLFTVEVSNPRSKALQFVWLVDGEEKGSGSSWTYQPQFNEGGQKKTVSVRIADYRQQTVEHHWDVLIQEVNRPLQIVNASPQKQSVEVQKGTEQSFAVAMEDPDAGEQIEAVWFLDEEQVAQGANWTFTPLLTTSEGYHSVKAIGVDSAGARAERLWTVTVLPGIPEPPRIVRTQPVSHKVKIAEGQVVTFSVEVASPHPELRYTWFVDGQEQATGRRWIYQPRFTEGGQEKTITVRVQHSEMQGEERQWKVSIQEVNRPPVIETVEPKTPVVRMRRGDEQRFMITMTDLDLDDRLTAVWTLDGKEMVQGQTWAFTLPTDAADSRHLVTVSVADRHGMRVEKQWRIVIAEPVLRPLRLVDVQPNSKELSVGVGQAVVFAVAVAKPQAGVEYLWLLDGQEESRERTWTYRPQVEDEKSQKTVTLRVSHPESKSIERNWQLDIQALIPPVTPPPVSSDVGFPARAE